MGKPFFVSLVIAAAACGGAPSGPAVSAPTTAPKPEASPPSAAPIAELGEMTIYDGKDVMARIHADGSTELGGTDKSGATTFSAGPVIKADGTFADKGGAPRARLGADGIITDIGTNQALPIVVTADSVTITDRGQPHRITLSADGTIQLPTPTPPEHTPRVEGADTAGKRRVVLALVGLMLAPGGDPSASP